MIDWVFKGNSLKFMRFLLLKFGDLFFCSVTTSRLAIRFNDHTIQEQENFVGYKLQNFIGKKKINLNIF